MYEGIINKLLNEVKTYLEDAHQFRNPIDIAYYTGAKDYLERVLTERDEHYTKPE